jgi:diguanylate cyclase (GGDEF)-like protein/PAS domain S-box-containing protein
MNEQDTTGNIETNVSRRKPTQPQPLVSEVLKLIPGALFAFQLTGERSVAMPYASETFLHLTGLHPEEIIENAAPLLNRIHPEDIETFFTSAENASKTMAPWHLEFRLEHPDKNQIWIEWKATPVQQDGALFWHGILLDITERKTKQWRLDLLETALNQSTDAVFLINEQLHFEYVNDVACHNLSYCRDELLGMKPSDIDPKFDPNSASTKMQHTLIGKSICFESHHLTKDGRLLPVEIDSALVEFHGQRFNLFIARDISERRRILEELQRSEQAYRHLVENLPDHVARWDTEGRYLYINPSLESYLSVSAEEVLGKTVRELFPFLANELEPCTASVTATGEPAFLQRLTVPDANGETLFHDLKLVPEFDDNNRVTSVLSLGRDMTDFYRAQDIFTASEREMRLLQHAINASSDSIFVIDEQLRFISVNDAACRSLGYSLDELVGLTALDIDADITQEDLDKSVQEIDEFGSDKPVIFETRHRSKDGCIFPVEIASTSFFEDGRRYAISVARDISERKRAQQALTQSEQAFRSLAESSPDGIMRVDLNHHIRYLNHKLVQYLELDSADEVIGRRPTEVWHDGRFLAVEKAATRAIEAGESVSVELTTVTADGSIGYRQILVVPERDTSGCIIGTLAFGRDITTLRQNERRLQYFVDNLPGMAYTFQLSRDGKGSFPYISPRVEEFYGLTPEEAQEDMATLHSHAHPEDRLRIEVAVAESARNLSPFHIECRISPSGMPERWLDIRSVPERQADGSILWTGIMLDITERKQASEQLRQREQEFRTLAENIPDNVVRWDTQGRYLYLNPTHERTLKRHAQDLLGKPIGEAFPNLFPKVETGIAQVVTTGNPATVQHQPVMVEQDEVRLHDIKMVPECDNSGRVVSVLALGRDMTDLYRLQEAVTASEQIFRSLAENIPDLVVRYDANCRRTFVSPFNERLTNVDLDRVLDNSPLEHWILTTDKKDAATFQAHLQQVLDSGQMDEWELTFSKTNGEVITLEFRATPEFGPDGKTTGALTMARDITARRAMEQQLRMAASVFDTTKEGIIITDPRGRIFDTNPAFSSITGYARDDALGQRPCLLIPDLHNQSAYRNIWSNLRRDGRWSGEIVSRRKNGERYYLQLCVTAIHDESGKPSYYTTIFSDSTQLKLHEQQLQHIAYHDALTGLPNRLLLGDRLSLAITQARRSGKLLAVLYLDLDNFKPINDNFGHDVGDRVLVEVAQRLSNSLRDSDTVARLGGDEFVALLADLSDLSECGVTAHRLLDSIAQPIILGEHRLCLSASIGISRYPDDGSTDTDILLRYADQAMYLAKTAGRNQFLFYGEDLRCQAQNNTQIIHDLRLALEQAQISVHYQPIINMATGQVVKAEALARWEHPEQGIIPPSVFIPAAENSSLIHKIGDLMFEQSVRVAHIWNKQIVSAPDEPWRISINLSPRQFFHRDGVSSWVQHLMEREISGEMVTAEITEGLLLEDRPEVLQQLNQLRDMGMTISLDDFGTGYSALSYLKKFDIDYLKIDRSFIRHITNDSNDRAIVEAIIVMAKRLGIKLVAEGVETRSQSALLTAADCDMAQGYWYAKPMPEAKFLTFVSQFRGQLP